MTLPAFVADALAYGADRYAAGQAGKTLLVGWQGERALFAVAAGLASDQDRERFAVLARYLLRRDLADGYWLLLSADLDGRAQLVAEAVRGAERQLAAAPLQYAADGSCQGLGEAVCLPLDAPLGDLLDGGATLAGIMRRELDRLAAALALPLP